MTGSSLTYTIQSEEVQRAFKQLERAVKNTKPIMNAVGTALVEGTHQRFEREVGPDGVAWASLNSGYAAGKRGPGILRESGMRGGLMGSITRKASKDTVEVGTNKVYAAIHQFGGTISSKSGGYLSFAIGGQFVRVRSVTIKARPFIGISQEDERNVAEVVEGALLRATR